MSFQTFFSMTKGLTKPLMVPKGTLASILAHVDKVEDTLGLKRTPYGGNPVHWDHFDPAWRDGFPDVPDELLCKTVEHHNDWVRRLYVRTAAWSHSPVEDGEALTPEAASRFWHALVELEVRPERWTCGYYRARMNHLYEVMRGRDDEGVSFDTKALTPKQAAAVIRIFDRYLERGSDLRLDVPHGHDHLASSYDGGYDWCGTCFRPMAPDDVPCRRRKCPFREEDAP